MSRMTTAVMVLLAILAACQSSPAPQPARALVPATFSFLVFDQAAFYHARPGKGIALIRWQDAHSDSPPVHTQNISYDAEGRIVQTDIFLNGKTVVHAKFEYGFVGAFELSTVQGRVYSKTFHWDDTLQLDSGELVGGHQELSRLKVVEKGADSEVFQVWNFTTKSWGDELTLSADGRPLRRKVSRGESGLPEVRQWLWQGRRLVEIDVSTAGFLTQKRTFDYDPAGNVKAVRYEDKAGTWLGTLTIDDLES